ncbi:MAG: class I SAM-dependent methyltransferase [Novosphingobium sp.]|nr:class I SAM-dependent methyltransferase [Novosphingobium sp.]
MNDTARQRAYYERTAEHYEAMHVRPDDEHGRALARFADLARRMEAVSVLDVGAGTGRALQLLGAALPGVKLVGVEPSAALRSVGHSKGISEDALIHGSGEALPFEDGAFDFVIETGMLHHVPEPAKVVAEMLRVARRGVMISDSNKFAQGAKWLRLVKALVDRLGLWPVFIWLQTRGKMAKWSEGDGLFYSYSVFDNLNQVRARFPEIDLVATVPMTGPSLRRDAGHICLIATSG